MRSLKDIYDDLDVSLNFSFLAFQPSSFEEAIRDENWVQAMDEEIDSIENSDTWELVNLPNDKNLIVVNWVYNTKLNEKSEIDRFNSRHVARLDTVRAVLATTAQKIGNYIRWMSNQPS